VDTVLGIAVATAKFVVTLWTPDGPRRRKSGPNTPIGFTERGAWLTRQHVTRVHACLEATGTYGDALATWLAEAGPVVSVVKPAILHADARTPEAHRLAAGVLIADVRASIDAVLARLDAQIAHVQQLLRDHFQHHPGLRTPRDLLTTIPGIGEPTAAVLIAELFDKPFTSARQAAAFAGLVPRLVQSGMLVGRSRLSKIGPSRLRKALYWPAIAALRWNPTIRAVRTRLTAAGKPTMVIVGAAMRKLIHLAYGVLKSQRPSDERDAIS